MRVWHSLLVGTSTLILATSLAARTPTETANPVKVITSEELERRPNGRERLVKTADDRFNGRGEYG